MLRVCLTGQARTVFAASGQAGGQIWRGQRQRQHGLEAGARRQGQHRQAHARQPACRHQRYRASQHCGDRQPGAEDAQRAAQPGDRGQPALGAPQRRAEIAHGAHGATRPRRTRSDRPRPGRRPRGARSAPPRCSANRRPGRGTAPASGQARPGRSGAGRPGRARSTAGHSCPGRPRSVPASGTATSGGATARMKKCSSVPMSATMRLSRSPL